ncbi:hypothetical protein AACH06_16990 [Ideonella sp. DXS29W]|uniref:TonB C-terminal domain-containing protein n=1 Tax=Ideonella lacteola TaxID=2984193 RepID=A0ABU9BSV4_9BURK
MTFVSEARVVGLRTGLAAYVPGTVIHHESSVADMKLVPILVLVVLQPFIGTAARAADDTLQTRRFDYPGFVVDEDYRWMGECNVQWPKLPFRGSYRWLSKAEKAWLLQWYESVPEGDAPPYPKDGFGEIVNHVGRAAAFRGDTFTGSATVFVEVNSSGNAVGAEAKQGSDPNVAKMIGDAVSFLEFDAALCGGKPCKMTLPVELSVSCKGQREKRLRGTTYITVTP